MCSQAHSTQNQTRHTPCQLAACENSQKGVKPLTQTTGSKQQNISSLTVVVSLLPTVARSQDLRLKASRGRIRGECVSCGLRCVLKLGCFFPSLNLTCLPIMGLPVGSWCMFANLPTLCPWWMALFRQPSRSLSSRRLHRSMQACSQATWDAATACMT